MIERTNGPLVDGTVYRRRRAVRSIESYHRAALSAHRGHSGISLALPAVPDTEMPPEEAWRPIATEVRRSDDPA